MVQLSPEVISSIDGNLGVHAIVLGDRDPLPGTNVDIAVVYTDRNGMTHAINPVSGKTDKTGAFDATLSGLIWDGSGTVTATVGTHTGSATFAVLDRTPPKLTITPPAQARVGTDTTVSVHITDEIGVSRVYFEPAAFGQFNNQFNRDRSTIVASGSTDATVQFDWAVPQAPAGTMITLYALGEDLSGNQAAAMPVTVTLVP